MRYLIMKGDLPSMNHLPARHDKKEACAEVERLEDLRRKRNATAASYVYKQRGDAFRYPRHDDVEWWVKEIE